MIGNGREIKMVNTKREPEIYNKKRKAPTKYAKNDIAAIKRTQLGLDLKLANKYLGPYSASYSFYNDKVALIVNDKFDSRFCIPLKNIISYILIQLISG